MSTQTLCELCASVFQKLRLRKSNSDLAVTELNCFRQNVKDKIKWTLFSFVFSTEDSSIRNFPLLGETGRIRPVSSSFHLYLICEENAKQIKVQVPIG